MNAWNIGSASSMCFGFKILVLSSFVSVETNMVETLDRLNGIDRSLMIASWCETSRPRRILSATWNNWPRMSLLLASFDAFFINSDIDFSGLQM